MNTFIIIILISLFVVIIMNINTIKKKPASIPEPVVIKPKRKYKKRVSKKNTITTIPSVEKRPVGRPKKIKL